MNPILEIRRRQFAVGFERRDWPKTRHYIVRAGFIESRLIVDKAAPMGGLSVALTVLVGLFLR